MYSAERIRLIIADDHVVIAEALSKILSTSFDVVATVHDGRGLIQMGQKFRPDVLLTDIGLPLLNGLDAILQFKRLVPGAKILIVSTNCDPDVVAEAFRRGASGYVPKTADVSELVDAIHRVLAGDFYISPLLRSNTWAMSKRTEGRKPVRADLTERQVEVLQLLAEGKSMKEAGAILDLTTRTVAFHKYRIMKNLRLRNDAELVRFAMRNHIVFD